MTTKLKHNKRQLFTDEEIEQYCQSVEKLLINIKDRHTAKKSKKDKDINEEHLSSDKNTLMISRN